MKLHGSKLAPQKLAEWRADPVLFCTEVFGLEPDNWQKDVMKAFPINNRICMKACKGPGKTWLEAVLAWNFMLTRPYPKIAITSVSEDNLNDNLWPELAHLMERSELLRSQFIWNKTRIVHKSKPEHWFMSARTWSKTADKNEQSSTLAGFHGDYVMFIIDEAGDVPDAVAITAEAALASGIETKLIIAGNPTKLDGPLYRASTVQRDLWKVIEITGDPDDPMRSPRVSKEWAREMINTFGKENPWVLVNVYGKFPPASLNTLLGPDEVKAAMSRAIKPDDLIRSQKRIGVDTARFGDDSTVIFKRQGLQAFDPIIMRNARSNDIADRVAFEKKHFESEIEFVDGTGGYGSGVVDSLLQMGYSPIEVQFAGKAADERFANKRAEMWWNMAEWIKRGGCLPNRPDLIRQLTASTYTMKNGKFLIEPKEEIKKRLGFSPDEADALALTFAQPEMEASIMAMNLDADVRRALMRRTQTSTSYDTNWEPNL